MSIKNLSLLLLLCSTVSFGQLEASKWYFGNGAGLDFSEGCPMPFDGSVINTIESSGAICSSYGTLLFYSDGLTVYTADNEVMENGTGLLGELSSTNGTLIIPEPGSLTRYYIFTADAVQHYQSSAQGNGINYSVVDMNAAGGNGAVVEKNINILNQGSEKLTAVRNANGYWVLTQYEDSFYAYPVTAAGVGTPVITTIGPNISDFRNIRGAIKFSPDGSKVAICHSYFEPALAGELYLYDFNMSTGVLSNEQLLGDDVVYYGASFSPNSQVLYASGKVPIVGGQDTGNSRVFQYNLQVADIPGSRIQLADYLSSPFINLAGLLQLSIDGKLYHSFGGATLSVITLPNRLGVDCNFEFRAVGLGNNTSSLGLPITNEDNYRNIIEYENLCSGDETLFSLNTQDAITSVVWDFGDPDSGVSNQSVQFAPSHIFSGVGTYTVTAQVTYLSGLVEVYSVLVKNVLAPIIIPAFLYQCDVDGNLDGISQFNLYDALDVLFIEDGTLVGGVNLQFYETEIDALLDQNQIINPESYTNLNNGQTVYASVQSSLDCRRATEIILSVDLGQPFEDIELLICPSVEGENSSVVQVENIIDALQDIYPDVLIRLYESIEFAGLQTNEIQGSILFDFSQPTSLYYRLGEPDDCIGVGLASITLGEPLDLENQELVICFTEEGTVLEGPEGFMEYEWSTGETTKDLLITEAGVYTLDVTLFAGCSGSLYYEVVAGLELQVEVEVEDFLQSNTIIVDAYLAEGTIYYSIDGGATFGTSNVFEDLSPGIYNIAVRDEVGCNYITREVEVRGAPKFFTPNSDGYNDTWHVINAQNYPGLTVEVFDRFGKQMTSLTSNSPGWDGTHNGRKLATNTYWYKITYEERTTYGFFTLITRGDL
ncbi:T9SS type B sorting domain-containing protein [uncultured Dokdonia sp.]|uniref:T9SS type B sorting domain-containing protein n=1 Tax=uncultured Dokdonia sp. TaxID=575653 RepID=UPI00263724F2|nr:T9SS type B sorting domain-containing protein [uncultured Dokdonia sp.]